MTGTTINKSIHRSAITGLILATSMFTLAVSTQTAVAAETVESQIAANQKLSAAVKRVTGKTALSKLSPSQKVKIISPHIAEVGIEVGVGVRTSGLKNVQSITLLAADNERPLLASFKIHKGTEPFIKSRVKLRKSTKVVALIKADGKYYTAIKDVKITKGGCGG